MIEIVIASRDALYRAATIGAFGAVGLVLTVTYSRRGPLISPVYAAILAALALSLARYPTLTYSQRLIACLFGFAVASTGLYLAVVIVSDRERRRLVHVGRLPAYEPTHGLLLAGHVWRIGLLLGIGLVVSAGVAFVST